jgi:stress response protein SCP2/uncharacterized protein YegL
MDQISRGQRLPLANISEQGRLVVTLRASGLPLDFSCFGLDAAGKLLGDAYMTFFNQPATPCGGVTMSAGSGTTSFAIDTARLPAAIDQLVITASVDGAGTLGQLGASSMQLGTAASFEFGGSDFAQERAAMLGNIYRKDGQWRFSAVGQGFNGGLDALVAHFGAAVADTAPAPAPARISLEKRIEKEAPQLINLVKHAGVSLAKAGLSTHRAKVALVLDISGSMMMLYKKGLVQQFADRILALGCKFDDDGEIDVFLFGASVHQPRPMTLANAPTYINDVIKRHPLEGDTRYGRAMEAVRKYYFPDSSAADRKTPAKGAQPVYVMFVTDGSTSDQPLTEKHLRQSSYEPIFWQFMGIGKGRKSKSKRLLSFSDSDFPFLEKLDDLDGRLIDNADFFSVSSPDEHGDAALYDLLMAEYPGWLKLAKQHGVLA